MQYFFNVGGTMAGELTITLTYDERTLLTQALNALIDNERDKVIKALNARLWHQASSEVATINSKIYPLLARIEVVVPF